MDKRGTKPHRVDVRVDDATHALLDRLAADLLTSRSHVLRLAVHEFARAQARAQSRAGEPLPQKQA